METVVRRNRFNLCGEFRAWQHRVVLIDDVHRIAEGQHLVVVARVKKAACGIHNLRYRNKAQKWEKFIL